MRKTLTNGKKALALFLSVLMAFSCWSIAATVMAADEVDHNYNVRVYVKIFDDAQSWQSVNYTNEYLSTLTVTDPTADNYGKPTNYRWGQDGNTNESSVVNKNNTAGVTLFYDDADGTRKYIANDMTAILRDENYKVGDQTLLSRLDKDCYPFEGYDINGDAINYKNVVFEYSLPSMPTEVFWFNDYCTKLDGTTFAIWKVTLDDAKGNEKSLWEGLFGGRSMDKNYHGSITPGGLKTCWEEAKLNANGEYQSITRTRPGAWVDYLNPNFYAQADVNAAANGGVSLSFTSDVDIYSNNLKYLEEDSSTPYYINVVNHSYQTATVSFNEDAQKYFENYTDFILASGETKTMTILNSALIASEEPVDFSIYYTLDNLTYEDGSAVTFEQPAYINVVDTDAGSTTTMLTLNRVNDGKTMKLDQQFQADYGVFETNTAEVFDGTQHVDFDYNYYYDSSEADNWFNPIYFRLYVKSDASGRLLFQNHKATNGTMSITTDDPNATLRIANLIKKSDGDEAYKQANELVYPDNAIVTATAPSTEPKFQGNESMPDSTKEGCIYYNGDEVWFPFEGTPFKPQTDKADYDPTAPAGTITFTNMHYRGKGNVDGVTFSGDINVYAFDKSDLMAYLGEEGLGTNWAPMSARYDEATFAAYEAAYKKAMTVLGDQKTTQAEINAAKAELETAVAALQSTDNIINQPAKVTYTYYGGGAPDTATTVKSTDTKYVLCTSNEIDLAGNSEYADLLAADVNGTDRIMKATQSPVTLTADLEDIDVINFSYWSVDVTGVAPAIEKAADAIADETTSEDHKAALETAKAALEAIDQEEGTDTPETQGEIDTAIDYVDTLIDHETASDKLQELIDNGNLTDEAKTAAQEVLDSNKLPENPTVEDKDAIDAATKAITDEIARLEAGITDGTTIKPDYSEAENKISEANTLADNIANLQDGVKEQIAALETELQAIRDMKDPEATKKENQDEVDAIRDKAQDIIDGIKNGSLVKPDYTPYNNAIADYEELIADEDFGNMAQDDVDAINAVKTTVEGWKADTTLTAQKNSDIQAEADKITAILDKYNACAENTGHTWGEAVYEKTEPQTVNGVGTYTQTCTLCGQTQVTTAPRADYSALNDAKAALDAIDTSRLTDDAAKAIADAKAKYDAFDMNLPATVTSATGDEFKGGEDDIKALADELAKLAEDTNKGIADGTLAKPDYSEIDPVIEVYNTITSNLIPEGEDKTTAEKIIADIAAWKADSNATAAEYQDKIDGYSATLKDINDKYAGCAQGNHDWVMVDYKAATDPTSDKVGTYNYKCSRDCGATKTVDVPREDYSILDDEKVILTGLLSADLTDTAKTEIETVLAQANGTAADGNLDQNLPAAVTGLNGESLDQASKATIEAFEDKLQAVIEKYADEDGNPKANATKDYTVKFYTEDGLTLIDTVVVKKGENAVSDKEAPAKAPDTTHHYTANALISENVTEDRTVNASYKADTHTLGAEYILARPVQDENGKWGKGILAQNCSGCEYIKKTAIDRADYSKLEEAVTALEALKGNDKLTEEAVEKIDAGLAEADALAKNLVETEQGGIDDLVAKLNGIKSDIENGITDGTLIKPDYKTAEDKIAEAKNLANTTANVKEEVADQITALETELDGIKTKTDPEATAKADQPQVNRIADDAQKIIDGIKDGTLVDPDYKDAKESLDTAKKTASETENVKKSATDKIAELEKKLTDIENDPTSNKKDDQGTVEDIKKQLDEITAGIKDGTLVDPDYKPAEDAIKAAEDNKNIPADDADKIKALEDELNKIKEKTEPEANAKDDQDEVDAIKSAVETIVNKYKDCANGHAYGAPVLTKAPTDSEQGEYTETCERCGATRVTKVDLADYNDLKTAVDTLKAINTENLTAETKAAIEALITEETQLDKQLPADVVIDGETVKGGQDKIDALTAKITDLITKINAGDSTLVKPDYKAAEDKLTEAEKLSGIKTDETTVPNVKPSAIEEINKLKDDLDAIKTKTNPEATKEKDQPAVDDIAKKLDDIIKGIKDGTLVDPNYKPAEEVIEAGKNNPNIPKDDADKIKALEDELNKIKEKTEPEANAKDDQKRVDEIKTAVEAIVNKYANCKDGHTVVTDIAVEGTCTTVGKTEGSHCSVCGTVLVAQKDTDYKHTPAAATRENEVEPTCSKGGYYDEVVCCELCKKEISRKTVSVNPDPTKHSYAEIKGQPATCTKPGLSDYYQCVWCQEKTVQSTIPALGHTEGEWKTTKAPTCEATGVSTCYCSVCGVAYKTATLAAKGYTWSAWTMKSEATCKVAEVQIRECSVCHKTETRSVGTTVAHSYIDVAGKSPTCDAEGYEAYTKCKWCGLTDGYTTIPATGHSFGGWTVATPKTCHSYEILARTCPKCSATETMINTAGGYAPHSMQAVAGKEPGCETEGYTAHTKCAWCDYTEGYETIPAKGHVDADKDGFCDVCGHDDGCVCHKGNLWSKIVRLIYSCVSFVFRTKITCCDDMVWYFDGIDDVT